MNKTAIILGATGLTGSHLLQLLLSDERYSKVISFNRNKLGIQHDKLEEHLINLLELEKQENLFHADEVFCCIGTTRAKTPDKKRYRAIDYGIPLQAARLALKNNISKLLVISSLGADKNSKVFYSQLKGQMQEDIFKLGLPKVYFFQPSLIIGKRRERRKGENGAKVVMKLFDFLIPLKYKSVSASTLAKAMLRVARNGWNTEIVSSEDIQKLGREHSYSLF